MAGGKNFDPFHGIIFRGSAFLYLSQKLQRTKMKKLFLYLLMTIPASAQVSPALQTKLEQQAKEIESKVIEWRRHFHQYPLAQGPWPADQVWIEMRD